MKREFVAPIDVKYVLQNWKDYVTCQFDFFNSTFEFGLAAKFKYINSHSEFMGGGYEGK